MDNFLHCSPDQQESHKKPVPRSENPMTPPLDATQGSLMVPRQCATAYSLMAPSFLVILPYRFPLAFSFAASLVGGGLPPPATPLQGDFLQDQGILYMEAASIMIP